MSIKEVTDKINKEVIRLEDEEDEVVSTHDTIDFLKHISKSLNSLIPTVVLKVEEEKQDFSCEFNNGLTEEDEGSEEDIFDSKSGKFKVKWTNGKEEIICGKTVKEALEKLGKKVSDIASWDDA